MAFPQVGYVKPGRHPRCHYCRTKQLPLLHVGSVRDYICESCAKSNGYTDLVLAFEADRIQQQLEEDRMKSFPTPKCRVCGRQDRGAYHGQEGEWGVICDACFKHVPEHESKGTNDGTSDPELSPSGNVEADRESRLPSTSSTPEPGADLQLRSTEGQPGAADGGDQPAPESGG